MNNTLPNPAEQNTKAGLLNITYFTDPLCCWSWGFQPIWEQLRNTYTGLFSIRYCMTGLLPGWKQFHDAENNVSRPIQMGPVWMHAAQVTGMPIDSQIWFRDPPASSYPACIAVKCAGLQSFEAEDQYLLLLRKTVMQQGKNIASYNVLYEAAQKLETHNAALLNYERFRYDMQQENGLEAFRKDISEVQHTGISRYPSLLFRSEGKKAMLVTGYKPYEMYDQIIRTMLS